MIQGLPVKKLLQAVLSKTQSEELDQKLLQIHELKRLWELCTDEKSQISFAASVALVELVQQGHIQFKYVMENLLTVAASGKNICGVAHAVSMLLGLQVTVMTKGQGRYVCPYEIRSPPHPFITLLCSRPESHDVIYQYMSLILHSHYASLDKHELQCLEPCLRYILLEPVCKHRCLRTNLLQCIRGIVIDERNQTHGPLIDFIIRIIPVIPISDCSSLHEAALFLQSLLTAEISSEFQRQMALQLLSLCPLIITRGLDVGTSLQVLLTYAVRDSEFLSADEVLPTISELLPSLPYHHLPQLLKLAQFAVCASRCPVLLVPSLLYVHSTAASMVQSDPRFNAVTTSGAVQCLRAVETSGYLVDKEVYAGLDLCCNPDVYNYRQVTRLVAELSRDSDCSRDWLLSLITSLRPNNHGFHVTDIAAALFIMAADDNSCQTSMDALVKISEIEPEQASYVLPIILFKLNRETNQKRLFAILCSLPDLATHKGIVGAVLRTVQSLSRHRTLRPLAVRLMCQLWRRQDRCYQYLVKMLGDDDEERGVGADAAEMLIARAAAVRDICKLRPHQHGHDMLSLISHILNHAANDDDVIAAGLALEALYWLCASDVIDIRATWNVMSDRLTNDTRPLILCKVCEMFSLVPKLKKKTDQYQAFMSECVTYLWYLTQCGVDMVQRSAYRALAVYDTLEFTLDHLPLQAKEGVRLPDLPEKRNDGRDAAEQSNLYIPGDCYTTLMTSLPSSIISDYGTVLSALVRQELTNLPRSLHSSQHSRRGAGVAVSKSLSSVPLSLQALYDSPSNPGLRPGLALGLLYAYDPVVQLGRDGRPRKHHIIARGRSYQQTFNTLLLEVPLDTTTVYCLLTQADGWRSFVHRLYKACLEARIADLAVQLVQDKCSEDQADYKNMSAWLWVRDQITETLKATSRGSVAMQSNGLMALSALATVVNDYAASLEELSTKDMPEFMSMQHWTMVVMETVLGVVDVNYIPISQIIPWGQTGSSASANVQVQCSACLSLVMFAPLLALGGHDALIHAIVKKLSARIESRRMPAGLAYCYGLALGGILATLHQHHYNDIKGNDAIELTDEALKQLETASFYKDSRNNRSGVIIGLGYVAAAMCADVKPEARACALRILDRVLTSLSTESNDVVIESLSLSCAVLASGAYAANAITGDKVAVIADQLFQIHMGHKELCGVCLALGLLCYQMKTQGLAVADGVYKALFATWLKESRDANTAAQERQPCVYGLFGLAGCLRNLSMTSAGNSDCDEEVSELLVYSVKQLSSVGELGIRSIHAGYIGLLHHVLVSAGSAPGKVPTNYDYLGDQSVLRAIYEKLQHAASGENADKDLLISTLLQCLINGCVGSHGNLHLPPCNWSALLSSIMRSDASELTKRSVLELAINQCAKSPSCTVFLSSWLVSPLYNTLPASCQSALFRATPTLCRTLPHARVTAFLSDTCLQPLTTTRVPADDNQHHQVVEVLAGLETAIQDGNIPELVVPVLSKTVKMVYARMNENTKLPTFTAMAKCLSHVSDDVVDDVTLLDFTPSPDGVSYRLGLIVRASLVGEAKQPIGLLNPSIDALFNDAESGLDVECLYPVISKCLRQMALSCTVLTGPGARLQWFMEFLGHMQKTVTAATHQERLMESCVRLFCIAVVAWSGLGYTHITSSEVKASQSAAASEVKVAAAHLAAMMMQEPWKQVNEKVIVWLVQMSKMVGGRAFIACLCAMKEAEDYKRIANWSRIVTC